MTSARLETLATHFPDGKLEVVGSKEQVLAGVSHHGEPSGSFTKIASDASTASLFSYVAVTLLTVAAVAVGTAWYVSSGNKNNTVHRCLSLVIKALSKVGAAVTGALALAGRFLNEKAPSTVETPSPEEEAELKPTPSEPKKRIKVTAKRPQKRAHDETIRPPAQVPFEPSEVPELVEEVVTARSAALARKHKAPLARAETAPPAPKDAVALANETSAQEYCRSMSDIGLGAKAFQQHVAQERGMQVSDDTAAVIAVIQYITIIDRERSEQQEMRRLQHDAAQRAKDRQLAQQRHDETIKVAKEEAEWLPKLIAVRNSSLSRLWNSTLFSIVFAVIGWILPYAVEFDRKLSEVGLRSYIWSLVCDCSSAGSDATPVDEGDIGGFSKYSLLSWVSPSSWWMPAWTPQWAEQWFPSQSTLDGVACNSWCGANVAVCLLLACGLYYVLSHFLSYGVNQVFKFAVMLYYIWEASTAAAAELGRLLYAPAGILVVLVTVVIYQYWSIKQEFQEKGTPSKALLNTRIAESFDSVDCAAFVSPVFVLAVGVAAHYGLFELLGLH